MGAKKYAVDIACQLRQRLGQPKMGAEIGAGAGETTSILLARFRNLILYAIDPWENGEVGNTTIIYHTKESMVAMHEQFLAAVRWAGNRVVSMAMNSIEASTRIRDGGLDFVFIDGDHRYNSVKTDLNVWWPKIRIGGVLFGHDYRKDREHRYGVIRAVDEFCSQNRLAMKLINRNTYQINKD